MLSLEWLIPELTNAQWLAHGLIFLVNISLLIFARPGRGRPDSDAKLKIFQALNILVLALHAIDLALLRASNKPRPQLDDHLHRLVLL